ncbi:MAG: hypothetical protein ACXAAH_10360 [Promethearchaeota archaeon]
MYIWFWRRFQKYPTYKWHYLTGWAIMMQTSLKNIRRRNPWWMVSQNLTTGFKCIWYALTDKRRTRR